jgi:hypothetical protein
LEEVVRHLPAFNAVTGDDARRIAVKLNEHVVEFLDGHPWKPFHHTLGISGYETLFGHPNEMFYSLSLALPLLPPATAARTREFLRAQLASGTLPFAVDGPDVATGRSREAYNVPEYLRFKGRPKAGHSLGLYSFWAYCHYAGDAQATREYWPAAKGAAGTLLARDYKIEVQKRDYIEDEAEKLNGNLAGLVGLIRLARLNQDSETEPQAARRALQLLELRVNLDRINPQILEKTKSASKHLHNFKLARYCALVPEVSEAVRRHSEGLAAARLQAFRMERNGWWLAFGDRLVGGENYTNPPHFSRALFLGATAIEQLPAGQVQAFVDVPWCKGDFYFIEKCALAGWSAGGRQWNQAK